MATTTTPPHVDPAGCPDAELLAGYVDGRATAPERAAIEAHLARCEDCTFTLAETVRSSASQDGVAGKSDWRRWAPGAVALAAVATLVIAVALGTRNTAQPPATLVAALNELDAATGPYRMIEPRLTVTPTHRPLIPSTRSGTAQVGASLALREAAVNVEQAARVQDSEVARRRAIAAALLAQGQATEAVATLSVLMPSASDPGLLNDIAAAYLSRDANGDAEIALELLDRAVIADPTLVEAWFNLGLAAQATGQAARARDAWTRYLALDPTTAWAAEARSRLEVAGRRPDIR
jgi:tetratricopeptide (TPR) repeat protein